MFNSRINNNNNSKLILKYFELKINNKLQSKRFLFYFFKYSLKQRFRDGNLCIETPSGASPSRFWQPCYKLDL